MEGINLEKRQIESIVLAVNFLVGGIFGISYLLFVYYNIWILVFTIIVFILVAACVLLAIIKKTYEKNRKIYLFPCTLPLIIISSILGILFLFDFPPYGSHPTNVFFGVEIILFAIAEVILYLFRRNLDETSD